MENNSQNQTNPIDRRIDESRIGLQTIMTLFLIVIFFLGLTAYAEANSFGAPGNWQFYTNWAIILFLIGLSIYLIVKPLITIAILLSVINDKLDRKESIKKLD